MSLAAGTRLGPYEILALIGAGGMGEVFRAHDTRLGRDVAIKMLPARYSEDGDRLRRFEQEARSIGQLNHPNVLAIFDVGRHEDCPYIVTELLEGENLRDRINGRALPLRKAVDYALQTALGLAAAHAKGIIHRDLKPENLYLTRDGRLKILDFGLAKLVQEERDSRHSFKPPTAVVDSTVTLETSPGRILGTMGYMSPEQVNGSSADQRSDIFSFGAVLFEMTTGKRAFQHDSNIATMNAILQEDPFEHIEIDKRITPELERIMRRCIEKSPEERFQSSSDLAFALESAAEPSTPISATYRHGMRNGIRPISFGSRRFWMASTGAALSVSCLAFLLGRQTKLTALPTFERLTFRRGVIRAARFVSGGQSIVYSSAWEGRPSDLYYTRVHSRESRSLNLPGAALFDLADSGEIAVSLEHHLFRATIMEGILATTNLGGGVPRPRLNNVQWACWGGDQKTLAVIQNVNGQSQLEYPIGTPLYRSGGWLSHPRIDPKRNMIAFIDHSALGDDRGSLILVDRKGQARVLSAGWSSLQGLAWRPDGREIWFSASDSGNTRSLHAVDLNRRQRAILRMPVGMTLHDISPTGNVLITTEVLRSRIMALAPGLADERELSWLDVSLASDITPDGKSLLISEVGEGGGPRYTAYLRQTDGSPAVKLGEGMATGISPDGKWALAILQSPAPKLVLLPTGVGDVQTL